MPNKRPSVRNEKQYEALRRKGMSKERAARISNPLGASSRGGRRSGSEWAPRVAGRHHRAEEGSGAKAGRASARTQSS